MKLENLAVCILSYERHEKIKKTLDSYKESSFLDMVDESFIYFNKMSKDDISLAEDYEMVYCGCEYNLGIGWGMVSAINVAESDYVLFLENDFILPTSKEETYRQLSMGLELVKQRDAKSRAAARAKTERWVHCPNSTAFVSPIAIVLRLSLIHI